MHCMNCGIEMVAGAASCSSCGQPVSNPGGGRQANPAAGLQANIAGALCYILGFVTGIAFLVLDPYKADRFIRFHAFQSIFLSAAWLAVYFALSVVTVVMPSFLWRLFWLVSSLASLGFLLLALLGMFKAYNHERFKLPVIGDLAERQA